jgi:hypothetical protein
LVTPSIKKINIVSGDLIASKDFLIFPGSLLAGSKNFLLDKARQSLLESANKESEMNEAVKKQGHDNNWCWWWFILGGVYPLPGG